MSYRDNHEVRECPDEPDRHDIEYIEVEEMAGEWIEEIPSQERLPGVMLKVPEGAEFVKVVVKFLDDGVKRNTDTGEKIVFTVEESGLKKSLWIKTNQWALINAFAALVKDGKLVGSVFEITRTGRTRKDTRYKAERKV